MNKNLFAFYDSGVGGIPYMQYLKERNPQNDYVYFADTLNFPYGTKSTEEIVDYAMKTVDLILKTCTPSVIILACNTLSSTALDILRSNFDIPFVGTVPPIKLASKISKNARIGLLATETTISSPYTKKLIELFASQDTIITRGDSPLIAYIENNVATASAQEKKLACKPAVDFFLSQNVDTIILGCTHFLHFASEIKELCGNTIQVVDSLDGVARQALKIALSPSEFKNKEKIFNQGLFITDTSFYNAEKHKKLCTHLNIPFLGLLSLR